LFPEIDVVALDLAEPATEPDEVQDFNRGKAFELQP